MNSLETIIRLKSIGFKITKEEEKALKDWQDSQVKIDIPKSVDVIDENKETTKPKANGQTEPKSVRNIVEKKTYAEPKTDK